MEFLVIVGSMFSHPMKLPIISKDGKQKGLATVLAERGLWGKAVAGAKARETADNDIAAAAGKKTKKVNGRVLKECVECGCA